MIKQLLTRLCTIIFAVNVSFGQSTTF